MGLFDFGNTNRDDEELWLKYDYAGRGRVEVTAEQMQGRGAKKGSIICPICGYMFRKVYLQGEDVFSNDGLKIDIAKFDICMICPHCDALISEREDSITAGMAEDEYTKYDPEAGYRKPNYCPGCWSKMSLAEKVQKEHFSVSCYRCPKCRDKHELINQVESSGDLSPQLQKEADRIQKQLVTKHQRHPAR